MEKQDIKSMTQEELRAFLVSLGEKPFRTAQIYQWMHEKLASSFDDMTNLSKVLRQKLQDACEYVSLEKVRVQISQIDGTRKYLFRLADGNVIESVLMRYKHGNSVCISSQERNLRPSEMLDQIYQIQRDTGERVSNVVVMGSGEPLDNYDNLIRFIHLLTEEGGLHISQRNVTVSTCGLVPKIRELADQGLTITLALSLHAPNDEVRKSLMPIARTYALKDVLAACHYYFEKTGRRMTFEYSLVQGVNDNLDEARELAALIQDQHGHVNLIPVNPIKERSYVQSGRKAIEAFKGCLESKGINVTIRREMGRDIDGACGQLRKSYMDKEQEKEGAAVK